MNSSSADMSELTLASETEAVWQSQDTSLDLYLDALYDKRYLLFMD